MKRQIERIPTALALPPGHLQRVTTARGGRYYTLDGQPNLKLRSVTSILSESVRKPGLERWRESLLKQGLDPNKESSAAASLGTEMHSVIEGILRGQEEVVSLELKPAIDGFMRWLARDGLQATNVETEVAVYDAERGWAGTIDAIFREPAGLLLIDLKSGSKVYPESLLQLAAYRSALVSMGCDEPIRCQVVCMTKDAGEFDGSVEVAEVPAEIEATWDAVLTLWRFCKADLRTTVIDEVLRSEVPVA